MERRSSTRRAPTSKRGATRPRDRVGPEVRGWLACITKAGRDAPADDARPADVEGDDEEERRLPMLRGPSAGPPVAPPRQHFTSPPPRFSEATLVKELEENGIGRPSTYAAIIATIMDRNTPRRQGPLLPTELGLLVNDLIVTSFETSSKSATRRGWRKSSTRSKRGA